MAVLPVDGLLSQHRMSAACVNMISTCFTMYSSTFHVVAVVAADVAVDVQNALRSTLGNAMRGIRAADARSESVP